MAKFFSLVVCVFGLTLASSIPLVGKGYGGDNSVELTDANFDTEVTNTLATTNWVIVFFSPNCGRCKYFQPEFVKVANNYKGSKNVKVGSLDVPANRQTYNRLGDGGTYPFVYFFEKGKKADTRVRIGNDQTIPKSQDVIKFVNDKVKGQ